MSTAKTGSVSEREEQERFRRLAPIIVFFGVLACIRQQAAADDGGKQFTTIDIPNAVCGTIVTGINEQGDIVGTAYNCDSSEGFLLSQGRFTIIDVPDARFTRVNGINAAGDVVGIYGGSDFLNHGFLLNDGQYTELVGPGPGPPPPPPTFLAASSADGARALPAAINDEGDIVGTYGFGGGFLLHQGSYTSIDRPDSVWTLPRGINAEGDIVGNYLGSLALGFLLRRGVDGSSFFTTIDVANSDFTDVYGINSVGDMVGLYYSASDGHFHGFLQHEGDDATIDDPNAGGFTAATGINSRGDIVGVYADSPVNFVNPLFGVPPGHGFVLSAHNISMPPLPRTVHVTFDVTVPSYTPPYLGVTIATNLSGWNPTGIGMTMIDSTHWTRTLDLAEGTQVEYKYTLGSWSYVEKDSACGEIGNRTLTVSYGTNGTQTLNDVVLNWRNSIQFGGPCGD